ncbi:MAG: NAD(P)H-quinone oxidoreductase [Pseudomonadota bacterium]
MQAVICENHETLKLASIPAPTLMKNQVLVNVKATAVNRADILQRRGKYPPPPGASEILGLEIAGVVTEVSDKKHQAWLGQHVMGLVPGGAYAEYCTIDADCLIPIPEHWDFTTAAAVPEVFLTAMACVFELGKLAPRQSILIHAGASGVGTAAIQLAAQSNAKVFFTTSSQAKIDKVQQLVPCNGINYKTEKFIAAIMQQTQNQGVDVIIDFIGAAYLADNIQCLKPCGRLVLVGLLGGAKAEINLAPILRRRLSLLGMNLRNRSLAEKRQLTQQFQERWLPKLTSGELKPLIDSTFAMAEVQQAHDYIENNQNIGKVILTW